MKIPRLVYIAALLFLISNFVTAAPFEANTVIVKFKTQKLKSFNPSFDSSKNKLQTFINSLHPISISKKFPYSSAPIKPNDIDITTIYVIKYAFDYPVETVVSYLSSFDIVQYAQPSYTDFNSLYSPNDPYLPNQWYADNCKIRLAWDICKGDTNVVIGVSDTGVDIFHDEFISQIKYNYADPINGIDDDADGYIDNYRGWDFRSNDNNPTYDPTDRDPYHGTTVAGLATAKTDNAIGIAGMGFKCKLLPVRGSSYDAIMYLADHGAKIINCSWEDGTYSPKPLFKDIIDYATYNKDALVVCAAGNSNNAVSVYPASYEHSLSIAGTITDDEKWSPLNFPSKGGSSFGFYVDLSAPATNVYTTNTGNSYMKGANSGTSYSSPIVAGIAGLVRSYYPNYSALQAGECVRVTSDNIDTISFNKTYKKLLGKGRVNAYNALVDSTSPSIRLVDYSITGLYHPLVRGGDTAVLRGSFVNYLHKAKKILVSISDYNGYFAQVEQPRVIDSLGTMDTLKNFELQFKLKADIPYDAKVAVQLMYDMPNGFHDLQFVTTNVNPSFLPLEANGISTSVTSVGSIGNAFVTTNEGIGFLYKNNPLLYTNVPTDNNKTFNNGLVLAKDTNKVLLNYGSTSDYVTDTYPYYENTDSTVSIVSSYTAKYQTEVDFNFKIIQHATSWFKDSSFVIYEYDIINTSLTDIDSLRAGLIMDWGVSSPFSNKAEVNKTQNYGYVYSIEPNQPYVGIKVLRGDSVNQFMVQVYDTAKQIVKIKDSNGFSRKDIFTTFTHSKTSMILSTRTADDIIQVIDVKAHNLKQNDTLHIAFALFVASKEQTISSVLARADYRFKQSHNELMLTNEPQLSKLKIVPNITSENSVTAQFESTVYDICSITITDNVGKIISVLNQKIEIGNNSVRISGIKQAGIYYVTVKTKDYSNTATFIKQ